MLCNPVLTNVKAVKVMAFAILCTPTEGDEGILFLVRSLLASELF